MLVGLNAWCRPSRRWCRQVTGDYEVFRQLVLARIIEPASQQDSLRVLEEIGRRRTYIRPPLVGL
jgi:hypothetical protein